ncbi:MAG: radical SAM family heme chaperone HemW [Bacillota bacterium]|nr:radical SAM family heme chaperone HemW [Bacillota bacterium]
MKDSIGLYIHIPFCKAKCYYCDFNSFSDKNESIKPYFDALKKEIANYSAIAGEYEISSVFIGGGTPSSVDAQYIYDIMKLCQNSYDLQKDAEISLETNPGTLSYDKLRTYRECGINRLSIGLQAWQNRLLREIGRIHYVEEFIQNYELARKAGFTNINTDLIFALPGQTIDEWSHTVRNVSRLQPEHISCYSLKIEEGTVLWEKYKNGEIKQTEDELDREMYYFAKNELKEHGYHLYEISNFSKQGYECKHNLIYWKAKEYLGCGAGAHSYFNGIRYNNIYGLDDYIDNMYNGSIIENEIAIDQNDRMAEFVILGMRLTKGISSIEFKKMFGIDIREKFGQKFEELINKGLVKYEGDRFKLTDLGLDLANMVFVEFI